MRSSLSTTTIRCAVRSVAGLAVITSLGLAARLGATPEEAAPTRCVPEASAAVKSTGPDVVVGDLLDARLWGTSVGIAAFSVGTTACNAGDHTVSWVGQTHQHPVISQTLYRLHGDRMEQIGMSWLKHGFVAVSGNGCGFGCQDPGSFSQLGVGCSDPYDSTLNGDQRALGPRSVVNASTGDFPFPGVFPTGDALYKRLQVKTVDLDPALYPGARYFAEGQYVAADDALAGNDDNNASYREITFDPGLAPTLLGETQRFRSAIEAWRDLDPTVEIVNLDVPGDGRFQLAAKAIDLGGGVWRYEYALHNLSSHRSARRFAVSIAPGTQVTSPGFHDVDYHSGEPYDDTDWPSAVSAGAVTWQTDTEAADVNANAVRFATSYNFRFDADRPPVPTVVEIGLFRAGSPASVSALVPGPGTGEVLVLGNGRFRVEAAYRTAQGLSGAGHPVQLTTDTGTFWFFNPDNLEMMLKVLNGCPVNEHFWVFAAGLTNVEVTITVTDAVTGDSKTYLNPLGTAFAPIQDTAALACE